jgi:hypothetical protein
MDLKSVKQLRDLLANEEDPEVIEYLHSLLEGREEDD